MQADLSVIAETKSPCICLNCTEVYWTLRGVAVRSHCDKLRLLICLTDLHFACVYLPFPADLA